jgi:hypothetical protein
MAGKVVDSKCRVALQDWLVDIAARIGHPGGIAFRVESGPGDQIRRRNGISQLTAVVILKGRSETAPVRLAGDIAEGTIGKSVGA